MTYYTTLDGKTFYAKTKEELVQALMDDLRLPMDDTRQFMRGMARWCGVHLEDTIIRTHSVDVFVDDLLAYGFLTKREYH